MNKKITIGVIVALVVGIGVGYYFHTPAKVGLVGGATNISALSAATLTIGSGCDNGFTSCTGSTINGIITANTPTCTASSSIAGSNSKTEECALTGILSTDKVFAQATTTLSSGSLTLEGAFASTTANGYIEYVISNASTTAITSSQNDVRNTNILILR